LGVWLGAICLLSFVVAPGPFSILASRDQAGEIVRFTLGRLHLLGMLAGVIYLVVHFFHANRLPSVARLAALAVILMILLTAFSQFYVGSHMADLRREMGSVERTSADSPLRAEFGKLHKFSVWLESSVLLLGFAAMYLTVRAT
jgi:hypothetical protein